MKRHMHLTLALGLILALLHLSAMAQKPPGKAIMDSSMPVGTGNSEDTNSPPARSGGASPTSVNVSGEGGAEVGLSAVASGCDIEPIRTRMIPRDTCALFLGYFQVSALGMFPFIAIAVEESGEYDVSFQLSPLALATTDLPQTMLASAGDLYVDIRVDRNDFLGKGGSLRKRLMHAQAKIMDWFKRVAAASCGNFSNQDGAPCEGFDIAVGNSSRWSGMKSPALCDKGGSFVQLNADTLYYIRLIQNGLLTSNWRSKTAPVAGLAIRRRCCQDGAAQIDPIDWPPYQASKSTCPCELNADSAKQSMLSSILRNDIENAEHRKIQLFEATLTGAEDYKFSFDPAFNGQLVFYRANGRPSYEGFSVIASQAFDAADGIQDILLDDLGDCAKVYMAVASNPCDQSSLDASVSPH